MVSIFIWTPFIHNFTFEFVYVFIHFSPFWFVINLMLVMSDVRHTYKYDEYRYNRNPEGVF